MGWPCLFLSFRKPSSNCSLWNWRCLLTRHSSYLWGKDIAFRANNIHWTPLQMCTDTRCIFPCCMWPRSLGVLSFTPPFHENAYSVCGPFLRLFLFSCWILQEMINRTCKLVKTKNKFPSTIALFIRTFTFEEKLFVWLSNIYKLPI